ncbi:hypothetical protein [Pseudonocardia nigra]|uniref:hypothetical protein n=1 Tax=Pseudonocardia nigra TaxID=1921578 RepID=UPI001C5DDBA3|nr:hypothetical protein [Pseudonocardia nigra]
MVAPDAAAASIAGSGITLMALGAFAPVLDRRLRRPVPAAGPDHDPPTVEMPTIEMPRAGRAA